MKNTITIDHGNGGQLTADLIDELIVPSFKNTALTELKDGAILPSPKKELVFSTDSFVVDPWEFPGGNIGKLAVCGTINDICMAGGIPQYLSCSLILEEGFQIENLKTILHSMQSTARQAGVSIVTGDTKVIEKQRGEQIFINTAGIGFLHKKTSYQYQENDVVVLSGSMGCHGASIFMAREDIHLQGNLLSDCASLKEKALQAMTFDSLRIMRDPTRGGVATTCIELIEKSDFGMELYESKLPVDPNVMTLCDLLGFDPLYLACEGRMLCIMNESDAKQLCDQLKDGATIIGKITIEHPRKLYLKTRIGSTRQLHKLSGISLPRIC